MNLSFTLRKSSILRLVLLVIICWPTFALAGYGDAPPSPIRTQEELMLLPLAVLLITIFLIFWTRRKR